jgi:hypothetical protein
MDEGRNAQHASLGAQPSVVVYIEELVLHGVAPGDRYQIGNAVQHELARLFAEQGAPGWLLGGGEIARLDVGTFEMSLGSKAETFGVQVAKAVYGGFAK